MILWQFIVLVALLAVIEWAAEVRDSRRNDLLKQLLDQLSDIEKQVTPITDLPENIRRALMRQQEPPP